MPTYALTIEYDGGPFVGWQSQDNGLAVQDVIEAAASMLAMGERPQATAAGRTDAGVHARGQVVHLELDRPLAPERLREALNFHAQPHPVVVLRAALAPPGWHARFSARQRGYRYHILNRRPRPTIDLGRVWHVPQALDVEAMQRAAQPLLGRHDFSAFRAAACQAKSPVRSLDHLQVIRQDDVVCVSAEARSFLHHQVRNLVGSLVEVGIGRRPEGWPAQVLAGQDRTKAGQTAPAQGLAFWFVRYDVEPDWGG